MKTFKLNEIKVNKVLVFDASSIIAINMAGMIEMLKELKLGFDGKFLISKDVYNEIIRIPAEIKKYELKAIIVNKIVEDGVLNIVDDPLLDKKTKEIVENSNMVFFADHENVKIIHKGEASCIALYELLNIENENKALVIDERTARLLLENPVAIAKLLERKVHRKINLNENIANSFLNKKVNIIRSSEIMLIGFLMKKTKLGIESEKDILKQQKFLEALLYGVKAYGCSISDYEIEEAKKEFLKMPKI